MVDTSVVKAIANRIASDIVELQKEHRELDRIGRVYRDTWGPAIGAELAKDPTNQDPDMLSNFRDSGRSALQWNDMATALYRVHTLLESTSPDADLYDPSLNKADIARLSTEWLSGGEQSGEVLNIDTYNMCAVFSRLIYEIEYIVEIYNAKVESFITGLASDTTEDGITGRTKKQWTDAVSAFEECVKVFFNELSSVPNGQGAFLNAF